MAQNPLPPNGLELSRSAGSGDVTSF